MACIFPLAHHKHNRACMVCKEKNLVLRTYEHRKACKILAPQKKMYCEDTPRTLSSLHWISFLGDSGRKTLMRELVKSIRRRMARTLRLVQLHCILLHRNLGIQISKRALGLARMRACNLGRLKRSMCLFGRSCSFPSRAVRAASCMFLLDIFRTLKIDAHRP